MARTRAIEEIAAKHQIRTGRRKRVSAVASTMIACTMLLAGCGQQTATEVPTPSSTVTASDVQRIIHHSYNPSTQTVDMTVRRDGRLDGRGVKSAMGTGTVEDLINANDPNAVANFATAMYPNSVVKKVRIHFAPSHALNRHTIDTVPGANATPGFGNVTPGSPAHRVRANLQHRRALTNRVAATAVSTNAQTIMAPISNSMQAQTTTVPTPTTKAQAPGGSATTSAARTAVTAPTPNRGRAPAMTSATMKVLELPTRVQFHHGDKPPIRTAATAETATTAAAAATSASSATSAITSNAVVSAMHITTNSPYTQLVSVSVPTARTSGSITDGTTAVATQKYVETNHGWVSYHSQPRLKSTILGRLHLGDKAPLVKKYNKWWYEIKWNGRNVYITTSSKYTHVVTGAAGAPTTGGGGTTTKTVSVPKNISNPVPATPARSSGRTSIKLPPPGVHWDNSITRKAGRNASIAAKTNAVLSVARSKIGTPYIWGHNEDRGQYGFDCSNYTAYVYHHALGYKFSGASRAQYRYVGVTIPQSKMRPGDLIIFEKGKHVGIYSGNNKMIQEGGGLGKCGYLSIGPGSYWGKHISVVRRMY